MCECTINSNSSCETEKKYRLADFFNSHWDNYKVKPTKFIRPEQYKAVSAIRVCRTPRLGIEQYVCDDCGEITEISHSCKNRFCPTCSWTDTMIWAEKLVAKMFDLMHRHVVFTIPHQLNGLIKTNDEKLLNILFKAAADTLKDWMINKYGIKPGIISVLHTFGEQKNYHAHIHMIISWGGININTDKLEEIKGEYVNYKFLKNKFRIKFEDKLIELFDNQNLKHKFSDRIHFLKFIKRINQKNWHLNLEPPMKVPSDVIRYIGRYSKRACISERKITNIEGEFITFDFKDYRNKDFYGKPIVKKLELHYSDFFPRLLQHVPLKGFRIVRYYSYYASASSIPEKYLYKEEQNEDVENEDNSTQKEQIITAKDYKVCKHCNKELTYINTLFFNNKDGFVTIVEDRLIEKEFKIRDVA